MYMYYRVFTTDDVELISTEQNTGNMGKVLFKIVFKLTFTFSNN